MGDGPMDDELSAEIMRLMTRRGAPPGSVLDLSAFRIVWHLSRSGPCTIKDLAEATLLDQSTMSRQVAAAVQHGLVERVAADSGVHHLTPTPQGDEALAQDLELRSRDYRAALAALDPEVADGLVTGLRAFNDAFDRVSDH